MVKPMAPSAFSEGPHTDSEAGAQGESLPVSPGDVVRRNRFRSVSPSNDVFADYGNSGPHPSQASHSQSFQSYDGHIPCSLPIAAPRGRISSLPNHEPEPMPRQRRRSAPVGLRFSAGECFSAVSTIETEVKNELPSALQDIAVRGQELFWFILSEEAKKQEADSPGSLSALTVCHSRQRMEILNERGSRGGRTLRQIAEAFSHSSLRSTVREHAGCVELQSLNYNSFSDLLFGLFEEGGITQARVLVLFFFCADVALRALRENLTEHFQQLVDWTSRYITEKLSAWVLSHGGWGAVLQESVDQAYKVAVIGIFLVGVVALALMWKRRSL